MIRGEKRALEKKPSVNVNLNASIHNRFDIEVMDAKTGKVKQRAQAENVICNQMWSKLFSSSVWNYCIHIGGGTGTPSANDTALFSFIAAKTSSIESYSNDPGVFSLTKKIQVSESEYVGSTFTEVGIGHSLSSTALCTHAMLQDMNGNQISIVKTDTDIINIYSTVFVHYNLSGYDGIKIIANRQGVNDTKEYLYGFLPYLAYGYESGAYGYGAAIPPKKLLACAGTVPYYNSSASNRRGIAWNSSIDVSYDVDNKKIICTASRVVAGNGNDYKNAYNIIVFTDYSSTFSYPSFLIPANVIFQSGVAISGDAIGTGDGETVDFTTSFPGISNCTVKVDGVPAEVVVDEHTPFMISDIENGQLLEYFEKASDGTWQIAFNPESSTHTLKANSEILFRNPFHERIGIQTIKGCSNSIKCYVSNDAVNWVCLSEYSGDNINVPEEYRKYEWVKFVNETSGNQSLWTFHEDYGIVMDKSSNANIHFATPPADGAVITADYTTDVIAKDENHVFDFSMTIQMGEYTEK